MPYDTPAVANLVLSIAHRRNQPVNVIQLTKLLYLVNGWHLAIVGTPALDEAFAVEAYGPVLKGLHAVTQRYGTDPIDTLVPVPGLFGMTLRPTVHESDTDLREIVNHTWIKYSPYAAFKLGAITRMSGGAWERGYFADQTHLRDEDIRQDFVALGEAGRQQAA